jgi:Ca-activated chloride channel homolog
LNFQFQYIEFLWGLAAIAVFILLFSLLLRWKKITIKRIGEKRLVQQLIKNFSPRLFTTKFILFSLAFGLGVVAVANLRKPGSADNISRKGIDIVITLDVSKSMLATDLAPNRLERAKQMILKLMSQMPNDRIALVLFAGKAYMQMPLTVDHGAAAIFVSSASPDAIPAQGTVFSEDF